LLVVQSRDSYRSWAVASANGLAKEWQRYLRYEIELPRAFKLLNLLAKGLCLVSPIWPDRFKAIVWCVEVPLDRYSLRPLACVPELGTLRMNWNNASMGSVKDLKMYDNIQNAIHSFCEEARVPPLAYDFLAWDVPHGRGKTA
jgi:hypothetical protein